MQAWFFLFALLFALQVNGHSMMTCAVLDSNNNCVGAVREAQRSLASTNYRFDNTNPCQPEARGVANLANKYSTANPMGRLRSGQTFTVQWPARNHAVANQTPRVVKIYLSPAIQSGQTNDYSWNTFSSNMICTGPYINCGNGPNVDATGDGTPCTLTCTLPTLADGTYTMLWHWDWTQNDGSNYMTCADIQIGASSQTPAQTSASSSAPRTSAASSSAPRTSASSSAQQSSSQQESQTPKTQASSASKGVESTEMDTTSQSTNCPDLIQRCKDICGDNAISTCSCAGGQFAVKCKDADTESSSSILAISALILSIVALF